MEREVLVVNDGQQLVHHLQPAEHAFLIRLLNLLVSQAGISADVSIPLLHWRNSVIWFWLFFWLLKLRLSKGNSVVFCLFFSPSSLCLSPICHSAITLRSHQVQTGNSTLDLPTATWPCLICHSTDQDPPPIIPTTPVDTHTHTNTTTAAVTTVSAIWSCLLSSFSQPDHLLWLESVGPESPGAKSRQSRNEDVTGLSGNNVQSEARQRMCVELLRSGSQGPCLAFFTFNEGKSQIGIGAVFGHYRRFYKVLSNGSKKKRNAAVSQADNDASRCRADLTLEIQ